jgi:nitroreductase
VEFRETIEKRRSVREFVPSEISDEALLRIVDAGRLAPSGCNVQNREYIIIRDPKTLALLEEKIQKGFMNAAAAIAMVMNPTGTKWGSYWIEDSAAATENMLLAIVDEGFDSVWIEGTLLRHEQWAKELLGVPEDKRLYVLLPIGKAAKPGDKAPKPELEELVFWEKYGKRFYL